MLNILIATHGNFAGGIKHATDIIIGDKPHVSYINAYTDDTPLTDKLEQYFASIAPDDQIIVLTDLFAGSVNQKVASYLSRNHTYIIAGINLAIVLEIVLLDPTADIEEDRLRSIVEESKKQIVYVNDAYAAPSSGDDFDF